MILVGYQQALVMTFEGYFHELTLVMPFVMYWTVDSEHMQQFINNTQKMSFKI